MRRDRTARPMGVRRDALVKVRLPLEWSPGYMRTLNKQGRIQDFGKGRPVNC